jgi:hypothetical protein
MSNGIFEDKLIDSSGPFEFEFIPGNNDGSSNNGNNDGFNNSATIDYDNDEKETRVDNRPVHLIGGRNGF